MRAFVKNYGCSANLADGQVLAGCLAKAGYTLVDSASEADVIIYNTCGVKGPTENRVIAALKCVPKKRKLVVAGCLPLINFQRLSQEVKFDGVIGPAAGDGIVDVVNSVLAGKKVVALESASNSKPLLSLPHLSSNPVVSVIPVSYGCLGSCAYCCVVSARGRLRSYTVNEIAERARKDLTAGAKELWITSQDTACYGKDIDSNLAVLLKALTDMKGDFKVRVGMMTPNSAKTILSDLIQAFKSRKIFKFIHLPVQSGDDSVLQNMNRFYSVQDFREIVNAFRVVFPKLTVATDIICGFPGETKEAFENTLNLINKVKPDVINVSKFFARPRTRAAEMRNGIVEPAEIKRRSSEVARLMKRVSSERNQRWVNWIGEVLVDEKGKIPGSWISRNFAYKPITLKSSSNLLGKMVCTKIVKAFSTYLSGKIE